MTVMPLAALPILICAGEIPRIFAAKHRSVRVALILPPSARGYGIVPALAKGIAPEQSIQSQDETLYRTVNIKRFYCVCRAGR